MDLTFAGPNQLTNDSRREILQNWAISNPFSFGAVSVANGNQSFSLSHWKAYFTPIAPEIEEIAHTRHLRLARFDHDSPTWRLDFLHPLGGIGTIDVAAHSEAEVIVRGFVVIDDYEAGVRTTRCLRDRLLARDRIAVRQLLNEVLDLLLARIFDGETIVTGGYRDDWSAFSYEEFVQTSTAGLRVAR
ncbi:MAG: hypothetical protein AMXMBFR52_17810 [Burkholderiales bacterium]